MSSLESLSSALWPVDGSGEAQVANGPNLGINWEARTPNPRLFVDLGREPTAPGEFAIDIDGFDGGDFVVGETYNILGTTGAREMELVGTFSFGSEEENALVGAVLVAFEEGEALSFLNDNEGYDDITVVVDDDVDEVISRIEAVLAQEDSDTLVAIDQQELIEDQQEAFGQILGIFQTVLLAFAAIILLVSAYLIFNVFTITLGQRIKELGLLRSIGAMGSQVTQMMLGEAVILGVVATIVGMPAGWALARLLRWGLSQLGFPGDTGLPIETRTVVAAIFVGVVVTVLAALLPSIKARQVTPMAALRDGALEDLDARHNIPLALAGIGAGVICFLLTAVIDGWISLLLLPVLGATCIYAGLRSMGANARRVAQLSVLFIGLALLTYVRFSDLGVGDTFGLLGAGALLTLIGASQVSGLFATPVARLLGSPPLAVIVGIVGAAFALGAAGSIVFAGVLLADGNVGGVFVPIGGAILGVLAYGLLRTARGAFGLTGQLARENAARNPSRTATTATALMIGLALVTGVTVIGESIKASVTDALGNSITSDWFIQGPQSGPTGLPFSTEAADIVAGLDEIERVVPYRFGFASFVSLQGADASEIEAALPSLFAAISDRDDAPAILSDLEQDLGVTDLSIDDTLATDFATVQQHINADFIELDTSVDPATSIWIEDSVAEDRGIAFGDTFPILFLDGAVVEMTVTGIYEDGFVFGDRVIDNSLWEAHLADDTYTFISATTASGVDPEVARTALVDSLAADYPVLEVQDKDEVQAEAETQINQTLATVNVLLLLSAVIAVLGIAIALSLAVFERTREIGLLRAVGTTRQQTRWMVRWEGVIVAAFGGLVGVVIGVGLGILATQKLPEFLVNTTAVPIGQLLIYVVIAAITGLGAGAFPAWIAGRMNVLDAISNE